MRFGKTILAVAVLAAFSSLTSSASAQDYFHNQYIPAYGNPATMSYSSPAPVPVPQWVGHTYISYPPLYPNELLYRHTDRYHAYYDGGHGLSSSRVHYSTSPVRTGFGTMVKRFSLPR